MGEYKWDAMPSHRPMMMIVATVALLMWMTTAQPVRQFDETNYIWFQAPSIEEKESDSTNTTTTINETLPRKTGPTRRTNRQQSITTTTGDFLNTFTADFQLEYAPGFVGLDPDQQVLAVECLPSSLRITVTTLAHITEWQEANATIFNGGMGWKCLNDEGRADAFFRRRVSEFAMTPAQMSGYNVFIATFTTKNATFSDCLVGDSYINFSSVHTPALDEQHQPDHNQRQEPKSSVVPGTGHRNKPVSVGGAKNNSAQALVGRITYPQYMNQFSKTATITVTWNYDCAGSSLKLYVDATGFDDSLKSWSLSDSELSNKRKQVSFSSVDFTSRGSSYFVDMFYFSIDCGFLDATIESQRFLINPPMNSRLISLQDSPSVPMLDFDTERDCADGAAPAVIQSIGCALADKLGVDSLKMIVNCPGCTVEYSYLVSKLYFRASDRVFDVELQVTADIAAEFDVELGFEASFEAFSFTIPVIDPLNFGVKFGLTSVNIGFDLGINVKLKVAVKAQGRVSIPVNGQLSATARAYSTSSGPAADWSQSYLPRDPRIPTVRGLSGEIQPVLSIIPRAKLSIVLVQLILEVGVDLIGTLAFSYPPYNTISTDPDTTCQVKHYFEWMLEWQFTGLYFKIEFIGLLEGKIDDKVFPIVSAGDPHLLASGCMMNESTALALVNLAIAGGTKFGSDLATMLSSLRSSVANALGINAAQVFCQAQSAANGVKNVAVRLLPQLVSGAIQSQALANNMVAKITSKQVMGPLQNFMSIEGATDCVGSFVVQGTCTKTCGTGSVTLKFIITAEPALGGAECTIVAGTTKTQSCNTQSCAVVCSKPSPLTTGYSIDTSVGGCADGATASACKMKCDAGYSGTALVSCASSGGTFAFSGCVVAGSPVDCVGSFSSVGSCSRSCGTGIQTMTYTITTSAANGGTPCSTAQGTTTTQECNTFACDGVVNCIGAFFPTTVCSVSCGGGTQQLTFTISKAAANGGRACNNAQGDTRTQACNNIPCGSILIANIKKVNNTVASITSALYEMTYGLLNSTSPSDLAAANEASRWSLAMRIADVKAMAIVSEKQAQYLVSTSNVTSTQLLPLQRNGSASTAYLRDLGSCYAAVVSVVSVTNAASEINVLVPTLPANAGAWSSDVVTITRLDSFGGVVSSTTVKFDVACTSRSTIGVCHFQPVSASSSTPPPCSAVKSIVSSENTGFCTVTHDQTSSFVAYTIDDPQCTLAPQLTEFVVDMAQGGCPTSSPASACHIKCAAGYFGTPTVTCPSQGYAFTLSGCNRPAPSGAFPKARFDSLRAFGLAIGISLLWVLVGENF